MSKAIDEVGNTYGYLTVIERAPSSKDGRAMWKCKCRCGNEVIVLGKHLRSGNTKSCGCYQKERAIESNMDRAGSLVGKRFGKLVILSEAGFITHTSGKRSRIYNCQCDCGNICQCQHQYLVYGDTTSCGCIKSKGELFTRQVLDELNIEYKQEYSFPDLIDQYELRFDFALFENNQLKGLIEVQGEQHYQQSNGFYNEDIVRHDGMKLQYCKDHNIPLYYIYYKDDYKQKAREIVHELYCR